MVELINTFKSLAPIADFLAAPTIAVFIISAISAGLAFVSLKARATREFERMTNAKYSLEREAFERRVLNEVISLKKDMILWKDANHLIIDGSKSANYSNSKSDYTNKILENKFVINMGIGKSDIASDGGAFILMPMYREFEKKYLIIKHACSNMGVSSHRIDEKFISGSILREIVKSIINAKLIFCVIDGRAPNVFYELGIAHALEKQVIIVGEYIEDIPFDVKINKVILHKTDEDLYIKITEELKKIVTLR